MPSPISQGLKKFHSKNLHITDLQISHTLGFKGPNFNKRMDNTSSVRIKITQLITQ
jgi:hypothetical protein